MGLKIWQHSDKINDPVYTRKVQNRLNEQIIYILDFSPDWQMWLVTHPDYLPEKSDLNSLPSLFVESHLDNLFRSLILGLRSGKIPRSKVGKVKDLVCYLYWFNKDRVVLGLKGKTSNPDFIVTLSKYIDSFCSPDLILTSWSGRIKPWKNSSWVSTSSSSFVLE